MPSRQIRVEALQAPPLSLLEELLKGYGERELSTTMAFSRVFQLLLRDKEIGNLMGWSPEQVAEIRAHYVDDAAIVVALGERLAQAAVKRSVKR